MRAKSIGIGTVLLLCALAAGCGSVEEASGPGLAVQQFYTLLNEGNYDGAKALYSADARKLFDDPDMGSASGFATWAEKETKKGRIDRVKVLGQEEAEQAATVECEIVYADGSTQTRTITMTLEGKAWRLGLVG